MKKILMLIENVWRRLDWHTNWLTWLEFALMLMIAPVVMRANPQWFVEDGLVENIQLLVLAAAIVIALSARNNRPLFVFAAMLVVLMIMRETNLFRAYFCARYLDEQTLCRWSSFEYGWIAVGIRAVFVAAMVCWFVYHKLWRPIWQYVCKAPIFVWDFAVFGLMVVGGTVAEFASIDNEVLEECCELISYTALTNLIYRYKKVKISG